MTDVQKIVSRIDRDARSLGIFAKGAICELSDSDHKAEMLDAVLMMLESLQAHHADLKQAMEGETNA